MWDGMLLNGSVLGMQNEIIRLRKVVEELRRELNSKQHDYDKLQDDVRLAREASHIQEKKTMLDQIAHREDAIRHMQSVGDSKRSSMLGMFVSNKGSSPTNEAPFIHYPPVPQQVHINYTHNGVAVVNPHIENNLNASLASKSILKTGLTVGKAASSLFSNDPNKSGFRWKWAKPKQRRGKLRDLFFIYKAMDSTCIIAV